MYERAEEVGRQEAPEEPRQRPSELRDSIINETLSELESSTVFLFTEDQRAQSLRASTTQHWSAAAKGSTKGAFVGVSRHTVHLSETPRL